MEQPKIGVIGSGSWATALAKLLTDNGHPIHWMVRTEKTADHIRKRHHNPVYLSSVYFNPSLLSLYTSVKEVFKTADLIVLAVPSAYVADVLSELTPDDFIGKRIVSAVKGILPHNNSLINDYLNKEFDFNTTGYFTIMGPCHAEEVAAEKLSYLTFSGLNETRALEIASYFKTEYLNTIVNDDVYGVQFAAVLKNIYALGAGMAHGLDYGDNFLSVFIANCADEMAGFLRKTGMHNVEVGIHEGQDPVTHKKKANYAASVYLGDLLVTCYSPYSRNRTFGNMIGKGYSVKSAQLEMNMVAEGHNAARCVFEMNRTIQAEMPIAETIYQVLWQNVKASEGFKRIEESLV